MSKLIASINTTIDGFCDHTAGIPDEELHVHYTELLDNAGLILYGRKTFQLMQYWQTLLKNPSGEKTMDDFAVSIDRIPKMVFSNTLEGTDWETATLAKAPIEILVTELRQQDGKDVLVGSPSLIIQLLNLHLIDEIQLCIQPVVIGKGLPLFDKIKERTVFKLLRSKVFGSGAMVVYYGMREDD